MDERLFELAREAMGSAHTPYSGFAVGAAVLASDGALYSGANVENAAYPEGVCAEAAAIAAMVRGGGRAIGQIAVVAGGDGLATPCGGCRQKIREFGGPETAIHVCGPEGLKQSFTLGELLPHAFGPENLE